MILPFLCTYCYLVLLALLLLNDSVVALRVQKATTWSQALHSKDSKFFKHWPTRSILSMTSTHATVTPGSTVQQDEPKRPYSFVQDDLRPYAMKLHTRDQAPKEGQQRPQTPFTKWTPSRMNYLQFLVDSLLIYETFEDICASHEILHPFKQTGLERVQALHEDIAWMLQYDTTLQRPHTNQGAIEYANFLKQLVQESIPKFMCHYYNHYFAHTAGGRMIGTKMSDLLLESYVLKFYQWDGDVKVMLDETKKKIDQLASGWTEQEKQACMEETMATFKFGGAVMASLKPPANA